MSLVREGWYKVEIAEIDWKSNKAMTGHYLRLGFRIVAHSEYDKKTIYEYLNFDNPSVKAVEIARMKWEYLCKCIGAKDLPPPGKEEPSSLVKGSLAYRELSIKIEHKPGEGGYVNYKIAEYKPFGFVEKNADVQKDISPPKDEAPLPEAPNWDDMNDNIPF